AVAAVVIVAALGAFTALTLRHGTPSQDQQHAQGPAQVARQLPRLIRRHPALRAYFWANALWEAALSALKAFIILYLTVGLGYGLPTASLIIGGVAAVILVGAAGSGKLADRFGPIRVVTVAVVCYGVGFLVPTFTTSRGAIGAAIPFIAVGGGSVMTMTYALLTPLMPEDAHGALTAIYSISRGVGIVVGPILAGLLIWITRDSVFKPTEGFQATWIVCAAATLASLLFLRRMANASQDRRRLRSQDAPG
ncbi:MAG: MFS transporter, partial [Solirubrobacteraceae bacterium]